MRNTTHIQPSLALAPLAALVLAGAPVARAGAQEGAPLPVAAALAVDDTTLAGTGTFTLRLEFTPAQDFARPYLVRVVITRGGRELIRRDHIPEPPTRRWRKGRTVRYELLSAFPLELGLTPGEPLEIRLGFLDPATGEVHPPAGRPALASGLVAIGTLAAPRFEPVRERAQVQGLIARARELRRAERPAEAWDVLELGLRLAEEDELKYRLRDELLALEKLPPRPLSGEERAIVAQRIRAEKTRYFRLVAGRMYDRREYHGALALLEEAGGALAEQADAAVLGALADAKRVEKDLQDVRLKLLRHVPPAELAAAEKALEHLGRGRELLGRAEALARGKRYGAARWLLGKLRFAENASVAERARARFAQVEKLYLAAVPPAEAEQVRAAREHPCWGRTVAVPSHRFIFIGPKLLVETIPRRSRLRYDIAYIFLTDLFGRVPNPAGDRVTVYFKELWEFGGGVGGGKTIDIGRADPARRGLRVDTGLLYHELTHCVDDTRPIYAGFREGLANMGAAYCFEAIGQRADSLHSFASNLAAFRKDYLGRDLAYWRIQNYGPSAGFFLHFLEKYSRRPGGHDWKPYRRFFRAYRRAPVRDGREPDVVRSLAHHLVQAFGPGAFDDLVAFRFPLIAADREVLAPELAAFARGALGLFAGAFERFPNSPLPRDLAQRELLYLARGGSAQQAAWLGRNTLGLIHDWKVIGPFSKKGVDPGAAVFPPEVEIDFSARYHVPNNTCLWRDPGRYPPLVRTSLGWIRIEFNYQDDTATYALCHVSVPRPTQAVAHVRADDDLVLFVNDERIGSYRSRGRNASSPIPWRGPLLHAADAIRFPVLLHAGRNKILLKIRNRRANAGFAFALARPDGAPIPELTTDTLPPDPPASPAREPSWKRLQVYDFRTRAAAARLEVAAGGFKVRRKALGGTARDKRVAWRKYTVRPGFPKDAPSNLAWLRARTTAKLDALRLQITLEGQGTTAPKLVVCFQGEGERDGLSGWSLIVLPQSPGRVGARLERYDRLVYQAGDLPFEPRKELVLTLSYAARRVSASLGACELFRSVPIRPIPGRHRIGFATFGPAPRIRRLELAVPR